MQSSGLVDILANVLKVGELGSRIICRSNLPIPWGFQFEPSNQAMFHIVKKGSCVFLFGKEASPITLLQGDLLFVPRLTYYEVKSSVSAKAIGEAEVIKRVNAIEDIQNRATTDMLCGAYELRANMSLPFFSLLPSYLHLSAEQINGCAELANVVQMLRKEDSNAGLGRELVLAKLMDILLILIIRVWLENNTKTPKGWLAGTLDAEVSDVLSIIHERPQDKLTIEVLAKETAMSRTKLLNKFTKIVGISPIQYLTNWRIDISKQLLSSTGLSLLEISNSVGYDSEAAFGRVFKKLENITPGQYRKNLQAI